MRPLRLLAWGLLAALVAYSAAVYGTLPDRIPTHLGLDGRPDAWADRSVARWFLLPGFGAAMVLLFEVLSRLIVRRPDLVNIPDKDRLLRLPSRFQRPVLDQVVNLLDLTAVGVVALFALIQWHFTRIAAGTQVAMLPAIIVLPSMLTVGLLLMLTRVSGALETAERSWKSSGSPTT